MRTALGRARRLVTFLLLALSAWWLLVRRRPAALPGVEAPAGLPAEPGRPGEVPADVLATDAGLTEVPAIFAPAERLDTSEPDELATDAGLTAVPPAPAAITPAAITPAAATPAAATPAAATPADTDLADTHLADATPAGTDPAETDASDVGASDVVPSAAVQAGGVEPGDTTIVLEEAVVAVTADGDEVFVVEDVVVVTELDVPDADEDPTGTDPTAPAAAAPDAGGSEAGRTDSGDTDAVGVHGADVDAGTTDPADRAAVAAPTGWPGAGPAFSDLGGHRAHNGQQPDDRSGVDEPTAVIPRPPAAAPLVPSVAFNEAPTMEVPAVTDDLRAVRGIGPTMERMLHSLGIVSFRQLALLDGAELERVRNELHEFRTRIEREDWIGQARALHKEKYGTEPS